MAGKIVLLDGYSLMYRAFHALQSPMSAPDGTPTNAVHGFVMMLLKTVEEEKPEKLAVAFDVHAPTLRAQRYADYKATRKPMPDELRAQDPIIREMIVRMGLPILEMAGYEADDILGTVSARCEREDREAVIVTGDRDSFQLSGEKTTILYTKKGISDTVRVTPEYIREVYGLEPKQMIDVKGLMGDASDNIPGVPGVGEKTALKLIAQYGSLEKVLDTAGAEQKGRLRERLLEHRALAELSKELATIDRGVPLAFDWSEWTLDGLGGALPRLRELRMNAAARRLMEVAGHFAPVSIPAAPKAAREKLPKIERMESLEQTAARVAELAGDAKWAAAHLESELTIATDRARMSLPVAGDLLSPGVTAEEAARALAPLLTADCPKFLYNVKALSPDFDALRGEITDVMLAAYALNPQRESFAAGALCAEEGIESFGEHPARALYELGVRQRAQLKENELERVYAEIELPLARVLGDMEREGFLVDADALRALGEEFRAHIALLTDEIAALMGARINLNSPKQLGEMLFDKMGLPAPKKTQRGYSTSAEVLENLAAGHEVCAKILEYRKYQKLESTYIDSLLNLQDAVGRIHSRFDQVATATGRISSAEPNLQNIPVRTDFGRRVRACFVPLREGDVFVSADYSQIELRLLAHLSGDEHLIDAFCSGADFHANTAARVFGIPVEEVTPQLRSRAKAVNFGIVYGQQAFGLAQSLGIGFKEAQDMIDRYFEAYPRVRAYLDETVEEAKECGFATTMFGRKRHIPELKASNKMQRSFGERTAMNHPMQGSAADIIKLAMNEVERRLVADGFEAKLMLQVHDELDFSVPAGEVQRLSDMVASVMDSVVELKVPLIAEVSSGENWAEAH